MKLFLGWAAVGLSVIISGFWAVWGAVENFHEGWYYRSVFRNLGMMFVQYASPMLVLAGLAVIAVTWPAVGFILYVLLGLGFSAFMLHALRVRAFANQITVSARSITGSLYLLLPLVGTGVLFFFGRPQPRWLAYTLAAGVPVVVFIAVSILHALRVAKRTDDGILGARLVQGNDVELLWASQGPGWPERGVSLEEALHRCRFLSEDGKSLADTPQDIWRLPTLEEVVRSLTRQGKNCQGVWNPQTRRPSYKKRPDKEPPLWNIYSRIIYWWTSTEKDENEVYTIVYNGMVNSSPKNLKVGHFKGLNVGVNQGFRAVKEPLGKESSPASES